MVSGTRRLALTLAPIATDAPEPAKLWRESASATNSGWPAVGAATRAEWRAGCLPFSNQRDTERPRGVSLGAAGAGGRPTSRRPEAR